MHNHNQRKNEQLISFLRRLITLSIVVLLCCMNFSNSFISDAAFSKYPASDIHTLTSRERKNVKIGYYYNEAFQEGTSDSEIKSGYAYEYIQKIASYTGWNYEYIYGEHNELYEQLLSGDIDLLAGVTYSQKQQNLFLLPNKNMGVESYYIYKLNKNHHISASDPESLNGLNLGILNNDAISEALMLWLNENSINCEITMYDNIADLETNLISGTVDAIVGADNNIGLNPEYTPVVFIGSSNYYLAINKQRPDLLEDLNYALENITLHDPLFIDTLQTKYFHHTTTTDSLNDEELDWVFAHDHLRLGYLNDYIPFCATDTEGNPTGLFKDVSEQIIHSLNITNDNLIIDYIAYDSYNDMLKGLQEEEVDVIFPLYNSLWHAEQNQIFETNEIANVAMNLIYSGKQTTISTDVIAVSAHSPIQEAYISIYFPDSMIIHKNSPEECFKAIRSGEASCTLLTTFRTDYYIGNVRYNDLKALQLPDMGSVCMGVRAGDTALLSLMNRGIDLIDSDATMTTMYSYVANNNTYTVGDFLLNHIVIVIIISVIFIFVIAFAIVTYQTSNRKYKKAKAEASIDALTQIRNRRSFDILSKQFEKSSDPYALALIDVDYFKQVNDKYGHTTGDQILQKVASLIKNTFRNQDYPFRVGGDEFALIIVNASCDAKNSIALKLAELNEQLSREADGLPKVSLSIGVAFSDRKNPNGTIYEDADSALYQAKENGRKQARFYEP